MHSCADLPEAPILGLDYGPFRDGQSPISGVFPTGEQLREDVAILRSTTRTIRTYSVTMGLERIVPIARDQDMKVAAGAWVSGDAKADGAETSNLVELCRRYDNVLFVVVGDEAVLRHDQGAPQALPPVDLIALIEAY